MAGSALRNTRKSFGKAIENFKDGNTKDGLKWLANVKIIKKLVPKGIIITK